ncbi:MAG: peptidase S41 [Pseudomonadota bacterium]
MSLADDLVQIRDRILPIDPSFRRVDDALIERCVADCHQSALEGATDAFLLSAMRLLALPGNGHTRLIPNDAISVLPLRFVSVGRAIHAVGASRGEVIAVGGVPVAEIEARAVAYLAGTRQRQRVIGSILLVWPSALAQLGVPSVGGATEYLVCGKDGKIATLRLAHDDMVPASALYPRNEHGRVDPAWKPETFAEITEWEGLGLSIRLPSFFDESGEALPQAISEAVDRVRASASKTLLIDVRGNTGGDFLRTMPLIDAVTAAAPRRVVMLVDKFTFSAAIVFVAILKHRLGPRLTLIGEEMGDGLTFFAEGGTVELPRSGAVVRYSTAFHNWTTGTSDDTTPPQIAKQLVAAGDVTLDQERTFDPTGAETDGVLLQRILKGLR